MSDGNMDGFEDVKVDESGVPILGRREFKKPRLRILSAKTGLPVPVEKLWQNLVKVADLEHATGSFAIGGKGKKTSRPKTILCKDCRTVVVVAPIGSIPSRCKPCAVREKQRERRAKNPEKVREEDRKRRAKNPEKVREEDRKWRAKNTEKVREAERKRRAKNPEKAREKARKWRAKNPEKVREKARKWRAKKKAQEKQA